MNSLDARENSASENGSPNWIRTSNPRINSLTSESGQVQPTAPNTNAEMSLESNEGGHGETQKDSFRPMSGPFLALLADSEFIQVATKWKDLPPHIRAAIGALVASSAGPL